MEEKIVKTMDSLKRNGIKSRYFESVDEAVQYLLSEIPVNASVGIGGSVTVKNSGIVEKLKGRGSKVLFHWLASTGEESLRIRREALNADIYLVSTNALTMDGKLVNIDGTGNRVAGMFFGPKKVYILCGINKIARDVDDGLERIHKNAYKNAERLKLNTPCTRVKNCVDCAVPDRMCNITVVINKKPPLTDMEIVIVNQELGY